MYVSSDRTVRTHDGVSNAIDFEVTPNNETMTHPNTYICMYAL